MTHEHVFFMSHDYHANRNEFLEFIAERKESQELVLALVQLENLPLFEDNFADHHGSRFREEVMKQLEHCNPAAKIRLVAPDIVGIAAISSADRLTVLSSIHGCIGQVNAQLGRKSDSFIETIIGMLKTNPRENLSTKQILSNLNLTLNRATRERRDVIYSNELSKESGIRSKISYLNENLANFDEFWLDYQPIRNCQTNSIFSYEALIRWKSPEFGVLFPGVFIHIAEDLQLTKWIDRWCIKEALSEYRVIRTFHEWPIHVNMSEQSVLHDTDFPEFIRSELEKNEVSPETLVLEISESTFSNSTKALEVFCLEMKRMGVLLAIDDFGARFSNFARIQEIPFDFLKIDKSFLETVDSVKTQQILGSIHEISAANNAKLIVEGVENFETLQILKSLKVDCYQGWLGGFPESLEFNRFGS